MNSNQFIYHIGSQGIFKSLFSSNKPITTPTTSHNLLAIRNNRNIYYSHCNIVRSCDITQPTTNYQLLQNDPGNYHGDIISVLMNSSGTLLALIGEFHIDVIALPTSSSNKNSIFLNSSSFRIGGLSGKIKKVCWQSCVANDSMLVVLEDSGIIKGYDITKSLDIPQIEFDTKLPDLTSISFASEINLSGGLTLYLTTSSGNIYSIYPFISKTSKLAITVSQVELALEETKTVMQLIQQEFPTGDLLHTASSNLDISVIKQYEYYINLQKQLGLPTIKEIRGIQSDDIYELSIVKQTIPGDAELQGPLACVDTPIGDITSFAQNNQINFLAVVSTNTTTTTVSYFVQISPILMRFAGEEPEAPAKPVNKYVKPKKGFGFIDVDEQDETSKRQELERQFWNHELSILDKLHTDVIEQQGTQAKFGYLNNERFALIIDNTLVVVEHPWTDKLISQLKQESEVQVDINCEYLLASSDDSPISSFGYIKDVITDSGEYLIVLRFKQENNLTVIPIVDNTPQQELIQINQEEPKQVYTKTVSIPLDEITQEINQLVITPPKSLSKDYTELLNELNKVSMDIINKVVKFTGVSIKLQSRIVNLIESLKLQATTLVNIDNKSSRNIVPQQERIEQLLIKQSKLNTRMTNLQKKLVTNIQKYTNKLDLPISDSELSWFKEINSINEQVNVNNKFQQGLTETVAKLTKQVETLVAEAKSGKLQPKNHVKQLELQQRLNKLISWLKEEDIMIGELKQKLGQLTTIVS